MMIKDYIHLYFSLYLSSFFILFFVIMLKYSKMFCNYSNKIFEITKICELLLYLGHLKKKKKNKNFFFFSKQKN